MTIPLLTASWVAKRWLGKVIYRAGRSKLPCDCFASLNRTSANEAFALGIQTMNSTHFYPDKESSRVYVCQTCGFGNSQAVDDLIAGFAPRRASKAPQHGFNGITHINSDRSRHHVGSPYLSVSVRKLQIHATVRR